MMLVPHCRILPFSTCSYLTLETDDLDASVLLFLEELQVGKPELYPTSLS